MTPLFRSIERSQTVHYWPWSRTSTSCLAVHCRSCTSSSAVQLKYTLTVYQRPSRLRDYLACTHANTSTVKYGGPASHPRKSQAARNRGAIPASGRPQWSQALHILYYLHTHVCIWRRRYTCHFSDLCIYSLIFSSSTELWREHFYYPSTSETQLWLSILCLLNLPY